MTEQPTVEEQATDQAAERVRSRFPAWTIQPSDFADRWWARNSGPLTYLQMLAGGESVVDADTLDELAAELSRQEQLRRSS